jgi:hypothetical protein
VVLAEDDLMTKDYSQDFVRTPHDSLAPSEALRFFTEPKNICIAK